MKKIIFSIFLVNFLFIKTDFIENKIEQASVVLVDVLEHVYENYIPCPQQNVDDITIHVKDLIQDAKKQLGKSMRMYTFITLSFCFEHVGTEQKTYVFNSLLYVEIDPAYLVALPQNDVDQLEIILTQKLIEFYESKKIGIEKVFNGCYVACVQSGVEVIS